MRFKSTHKVIGAIDTFAETVVKNEPMLFSATINYARGMGGRITKQFVDRLPVVVGRNYLIDSRVHMLMPGWYPCIPGWHLDDIPRTRADGQPDHEHPAYESENIMAIVGDASRTEFIEGQLDLKETPLYEGAVYGKWNAEINRILARQNNTVYTTAVVPSTIVHFGYGAFHRGVPATKNGWRFFIRANYNTARKAMNEIRKQTQVYLPIPEVGW